MKANLLETQTYGSKTLNNTYDRRNRSDAVCYNDTIDNKRDYGRGIGVFETSRGSMPATVRNRQLTNRMQYSKFSNERNES